MHGYRTQRTERTEPVARKPMLVAALVLAVLLLPALCPRPAQAESSKSYSFSDVSIDAAVNVDGTIHVVEKRTVDFSGSYHRLYWNLNTYNSQSGIESSYVVNGVSLDGAAITQVTFQSA